MSVCKWRGQHCHGNGLGRSGGRLRACTDLLSPVSISGGRDPPRCLAVPALHAELLGRGGSLRLARAGPLVRERPQLGAKIWADDCTKVAAAPTSAEFLAHLFQELRPNPRAFPADLREVTNGGDQSVIPLGVIGFDVSPEDDIITRYQFVEALYLRGLHNLNGRPGEAEEQMTRPVLQHQSPDGRVEHNKLDKGALSKEQTFEIVYGHPSAAETDVSTGNFEISPEEIVSSFYQSILGRSPDEAGLLHHTRRIREGTALTEVVRDFLNSAESKLRGGVALGHLDALPPNVIDLDLSPAKRQLLWDHLITVWSRLGREDPYWSVLTSEDFRIANMSRADQIDRFYESGRLDIERLVKYLSRNGRRLPEHGTCVDFGCGLGRTTLWLARRCKRVLGVDVSENHINIARESLAARGVTNVDFHLVRTRRDLDVLRGIDFFHSVIVLQHSPPPLIADVLSTVFDGLNPDGSAFFQVPTYAIDYRWQYEEYLAETVPRQSMEMHVLPQSVIFDLAAKAGCVALEVQPDHCTGLRHWISNTCVFAKPGPPYGAGDAPL
jgi:2-polyprenyl-3-methyl-5-hydroxy-6-metoxy-1,4-benzoquinol methylase